MTCKAPARRPPRSIRLVAPGLLALAAAGDVAAATPTATSGTAAPARPATAPTLVDADAAAVLEAVRAPGAMAVIVNLWASWCAPCREEFPDILRVGRELKPRGVRLLLVSGDFEASRADAVKFLEEQGVSWPTFIKTGGEAAFMDALEPTWSGMMPSTLIYDRAGNLKHLHEGLVTYKELRKLVLEVVDSPGGRPGKESGS